jgi:hypothetical protein
MDCSLDPFFLSMLSCIGQCIHVIHTNNFNRKNLINRKKSMLKTDNLMTTLWTIYNPKHETTKLEMKDGTKNVYMTFHEIMCGAFFKNTNCNSLLCYIFLVWANTSFISPPICDNSFCCIRQTISPFSSNIQRA